MRLRDLSLHITFALHAGQHDSSIRGSDTISLNEANEDREIAPHGYHLVCWASDSVRFWLEGSGGCQLPPECDFGGRYGVSRTSSFEHLEQINGDYTLQLIYQVRGTTQTTDVLGPVNGSVQFPMQVRHASCALQHVLGTCEN